MKRLYILVACAALAGCGITADRSTPILPAPGQIASHTTADDLAMKRAEELYKASRTIGEMLVDAGILKGDAALKAAALDDKLFAALKVARSSYAAFNSETLLEASGEVSRLAAELTALVKGDPQ